MGKELFEDAVSNRERIIETLPVFSEERLPLSVAYFWPTKYCPIGCEHCMFASPKLERVDRNMILSNVAIDNFIKISKVSNLESLVVSGGGEPTLEMDTVTRLIKEANFNYFEIITGAQWTANENLIHKTLGTIQAALTERKNNGDDFRFSLRISLDVFHQKVVKLEWLGNLIKILRQDSFLDSGSKKYPEISLFFRTLLVEGEDSAEKLAELVGAQLGSMDNYVRNIVFLEENEGLNRIPVFYKDMRFVGNAKQMDGVRKSVDFDEYFENYSKKEGGDIRLGMSYIRPGSHGEALKGVNVFISYDGKMMPYGGTPDVILNINQGFNYDEYVSRLMQDIVSRTLLKKGLKHIQTIAEEVDSGISQRVSRKNWLASVADESLATPELRLYTTIRLIQEEIKSGELNIDILPSWVSNYIGLSKQELIESYNEHVKKQRPVQKTYGNEMIEIVE